MGRWDNGDMRNVVLETCTPMHAHAHMHLPSSPPPVERQGGEDGWVRPWTGNRQDAADQKIKVLTLCQPVSCRSGAESVGSGVQRAAISP